jgi:hypothetical protein
MGAIGRRLSFIMLSRVRLLTSRCICIFLSLIRFDCWTLFGEDFYPNTTMHQPRLAWVMKQILNSFRLLDPLWGRFLSQHYHASASTRVGHEAKF